MSNILIFHDKANYGEVLGKKGHKTFPFTEKDAALDCARSQKLDLALVNLEQPAGLEVMRELRQVNPDLRLINMTGLPSLPTLRQAISLGTQEIILTPVDAAELESKVNKVLQATKRNLKEALAL